MRLRGKLLGNVTPGDILALKTDDVAESLRLEYKEQLPSAQDDKKDFLKDVTAFANTTEGVILFGIKEKREGNKKTGLIEEIVGVGQAALDDEKRRLEQMIRDNTDPQLTGCLVTDIALPSGELVIAVGVRRSLMAPHALSKTGGGGTYWRRAGTSNYPVNTRELRQMFLERDEWGREAEEFRRSRIAPAGQAWTDEPDWSSYLHVLPLGRLTEIVNIVAHRGELALLEPLARASCENRPNLDGYITYWPRREQCNRYTQWFRFGGVEIGSARHLFRDPMGKRKLDAVHVALDAVQRTKAALKFMNERLELDPPYVVFLSLLGTLKVPIGVEGWERHFDELDQPNEIDSAQLLLPGILIQEAECDVKAELLPTLDMIWQAAGFDDCFMRRSGRPWGED